MIANNKIEFHIPSVMGFEKIVMECAASMAQKMGFTEDRIEKLGDGCCSGLSECHGAW
jgi:hypothetical protein